MLTLKAKNLNISSGRTNFVIVNQEDAMKHDIHVGDRIKISNGKKNTVAIIQTIHKNSMVPCGIIGIMQEVQSIINSRNGQKLKITFEPKPESVKFIREKMAGKTLSNTEIRTIIKDIVDNKLSDIEMTYFISACFTHTMNIDEVADMTLAMVDTGDKLVLNRKKILDKHCIGGVAGNRTTMIIVPIIASLGLTIPKTSSRSITSASGTADTTEVLCDVSLSLQKMKKTVMKTNGCLVWGGALRLAPADDKIIYVERPLNIDSESQLIASIMSKKHSVGATHILIDVPIGRGSKVESKVQALRLKRQFMKIGRKLKKKIKVITTDGSQPIGNGIGPALEARDILWILRRDKRGPKDLERKGLMMATTLLKMAGIRNAAQKARSTLESGAALKKMIEIIKMQGKKITDPEKIIIGKFTRVIRANKDGRITHLDNEALCKIARVAGAPTDKGAGIYLNKHVKDKVKQGDAIYTIYSQSEEKMKFATERTELRKSFEIK